MENSMGSPKKIKNRMTTKSPVVAGMMGQWVKYLLYKHEDLSLGIPRPQEYPSVVGSRDQRLEDLRGSPTCLCNCISKLEAQ